MGWGRCVCLYVCLTSRGSLLGPSRWCIILPALLPPRTNSWSAQPRSFTCRDISPRIVLLATRKGGSWLPTQTPLQPGDSCLNLCTGLSCSAEICPRPCTCAGPAQLCLEYNGCGPQMDQNLENLGHRFYIAPYTHTLRFQPRPTVWPEILPNLSFLFPASLRKFTRNLGRPYIWLFHFLIVHSACFVLDSSHILTFKLPRPLMKYVLLSAHDRWGNGGLEKSSNWSRHKAVNGNPEV